MIKWGPDEKEGREKWLAGPVLTCVFRCYPTGINPLMTNSGNVFSFEAPPKATQQHAHIVLLMPSQVRSRSKSGMNENVPCTSMGIGHRRMHIARTLEKFASW